MYLVATCQLLNMLKLSSYQSTYCHQNKENSAVINANQTELERLLETKSFVSGGFYFVSLFYIRVGLVPDQTSSKRGNNIYHSKVWTDLESL